LKTQTTPQTAPESKP